LGSVVGGTQLVLAEVADIRRRDAPNPFFFPIKSSYWASIHGPSADGCISYGKMHVGEERRFLILLLELIWLVQGPDADATLEGL
jgi:hypothetical protein